MNARGVPACKTIGSGLKLAKSRIGNFSFSQKKAAKYRGSYFMIRTETVGENDPHS